MRLEFVITPRKMGLILGVLSISFALQSVIVEYLIENVLDNDLYHSLVLTFDLFSVNAEQTIPTWYSTLLLFIAAVLLAFITAAKRAGQDRYWRHWGGLAVVFLYLSMDEGAVIHEIVADGLQNTLNLTGFLAFGWQIVAVPLVLLFGLLYLRFLIHLPRRTRNLFILAALLYVGGALIVEGISANQYYVEGGVTFTYLAIATIEELCEMLGVVVLIYMLLAYMVEQQFAFSFRPRPVFQETPDVTVNNRTAADNSQNSITAHLSDQRVRPLLQKRLLIRVGVIIASINLALISWAFNTPRPSKLPTESSVMSAEALIDHAVTNDVLMTRLVGKFSTNNLEARQVAKALLEIYDDVVIISFASSASSFALAAEKLPFDQAQLSSLLQENNETQFIIFDTSAVRAIIGNLQ